MCSWIYKPKFLSDLCFPHREILWLYYFIVCFTCQIIAVNLGAAWTLGIGPTHCFKLINLLELSLHIWDVEREEYEQRLSTAPGAALPGVKSQPYNSQS